MMNVWRIKGRRGVLMTIILVVVLGMIVCAVRYICMKNNMVTTSPPTSGEDPITQEMERQFEEQFWEVNEELEGIANILETECQDMNDEERCSIVFTEEEYSKSSIPGKIKLLFTEELIFDENSSINPALALKVSQNEQLIQTLKEIQEKDLLNEIMVVYDRDYKKMYISFYIKLEKTPYITGNNGSSSLYVYSPYFEWEDGFSTKLKEHWYMWIPRFLE